MAKDVTKMRAAFLAHAVDVKAPQAARDPVKNMLAQIDGQFPLIEQAKKGQEVNPRSAWFHKRGDIYVVKVGREALDMGNGKTQFGAKNLDEVKSLLEQAKALIEADDELKAVIVKKSNERSERLKKARAK